MATKTVVYNNKPEEGTIVPITEFIDRPTQVKLQDGTVLSMRTIVLEIVRLNQHRDEQGNPTYVVQSGSNIAIDILGEGLK